MEQITQADIKYIGDIIMLVGLIFSALIGFLAGGTR